MGETYFFEHALTNKDLFTSLILLGIIFVCIIPLFLYMTKQYKDGIKQLITQNNLVMTNGFNRIALSLGKTVISDHRLLRQVGERIMSSSNTQKLDFLKRRLEQNHIDKKQDEIKNHIRTQLNLISEKSYIEFLNNFNTPMGLYGDWIKDNFSNESFLDTLYKVFFAENTIERKLELITSIIQDFQAELWDNFKLAINNKNND